MLAWRREREPVSCSVASTTMPAARRLTSVRTRIEAMTANAIVAAAANTSTLIMTVGSLAAGNRVKIVSMASDLEADHAVHDVVADHHPRAGRAQRQLGEVDVPDAGIEVGRDQ